MAMSKPTPPPTLRGKTVYFIWNNMPRFVLLIMVALIFVLMGSIKEKNGNLQAEKAAEIGKVKPPVNAVSFSLSPTTITDRINLPGAIEPWTRLMLLSKIGGTITEVIVQEGDLVKKGDILAKIEDADFLIGLEKANAAYKQAQADLERDKSIYAKGVIPTATLEADRTRVQTAKADYDNAKLMLSRTQVISPMGGIIRKLDAKIGLQLSVGDPIAEILEIDRVKGVIGIPESDVTAVRNLNSVDITIQALDNRTITAKKHFLSPAPETIARLYNLELEIDNSASDIFAGMFIRADVVKSQIHETLAVPFYSVISRSNEHYVYVEEDGIAHKRNVELGIMEQWMVQITAGLQPGDMVLIEGHRDVEDGQSINVIKNITEQKDLML